MTENFPFLLTIKFLYTYTWEYHKETSHAATFISNKQKCHFLVFASTKSEEEGTSLAQGEVGTSEKWEVVVGQYSAKNVYLCMEIQK
jgi:hypothetical protein